MSGNVIQLLQRRRRKYCEFPPRRLIVSSQRQNGSRAPLISRGFSKTPQYIDHVLYLLARDVMKLNGYDHLHEGTGDCVRLGPQSKHGVMRSLLSEPAV